MAIASHVRPAASSAWNVLAGNAAQAAGRVTGLLERRARLVPGIGGAGLVAYGAWLVFRPAGFIVAGGFLLLLDRRL